MAWLITDTPKRLVAVGPFETGWQVLIEDAISVFGELHHCRYLLHNPAGARHHQRPAIRPGRTRHEMTPT
jgi:hypothetical protein